MTQSTITGLINNAALLIALGLLYDTLFLKFIDAKPRRNQILTGLIIGSIGIAIMMSPWEFMPGLVFDTRSVLLCIAGFFFGPVPTTIAVIMTGAYRVYLGGPGMWMGIAVIITSGLIGILWRQFRKENLENFSIMEFYALGIVVHVTMLICTALLPWPAIKKVLFTIGLPVMIIFPFGTALLGQLMLNRYNRKKTEIELIQIKDFTQNALNAQNDTFFILDPANGKAIWWNRAFNDISGYSDEEILNLKAPDSYYSNADLEKAVGAIGEMSRKGKATVEISLISKTGTTIPFEYSISPIINYEQKKQFIISIGRDISERKRSEYALKKSEARFRAITSTAEDAIFCKDANRRYTFVNQAMARMLAMREEDFIGRTPEEVFDADSAAIIKEVDDRTFNGQMVNEIRSLKIYKQEFIFNTIQVPLEIKDGNVVSISGIVRDITDIINAQNEKLNLEVQLRQSQKIESIGIFSGGIAHDFNNLLYVISGNTELLLQSAVPGAKDLLNNILNAVRRGSDLVKQLLTFTRKSETNLQTIRLNDEIRRIYKMLERVIPKMVEIRMNLAENLFTVDADPGQIEQVLMNLSLNARDAMSGSGTLLIKTENTIRNNERSVLLKISDTGHGIDPGVREKIFDPFFTTKEIGKGSGLGLSVIYGIIKAHNGEISCASEPGKGTTFAIYLPAAKGPEVFPSNEKRKKHTLAGGNETILVIDDDESVLTLTKTILTRLGYKTIPASNGEFALDIYSKNRDTIGLVILDLNMPGMGGIRCLEELLRIDPNVRVVVASGYTEKGMVKDTLKHGAKASILKPYTIENFSNIIRSVLDNRPD